MTRRTMDITRTDSLTTCPAHTCDFVINIGTLLSVQNIYEMNPFLSRVTQQIYLSNRSVDVPTCYIVLGRSEALSDVTKDRKANECSFFVSLSLFFSF